MGTPDVSAALRIGVESVLGGRLIQQDAYVSLPHLLNCPDGPLHVFGVFDGHGSEGHKCSEFVKTKLQKVLLSQRELLLATPLKALEAAFTSLHEQLLEESSIDSYLSGTTALVVIVVKNNVYVASVGDCRLVIVKKSGLGRQITIDHTCALASEKERVLAKGARVEQLWNEKLKAVEGPLRIFKGTLPYPG